MTAVPLQAPLSGTIEQWLVEGGEDVRIGEDLVIINDKQRSVTVTSDAEGVVKTILHPEGKSVRLGWKLAIIEEVEAAVSSLENAMPNDSKFLKDIKQVVEDAVKPRFDAIDKRFDAMETKIDGKFADVSAKLDQLLAGKGGKSGGTAPKPPKR